MTNEQPVSLNLKISNGGRVLHSWKEIASYTGRGVRTIQRYEMQLGFPVRRPSGSSRSAVLAFTNEIDAWLAHSPKRSESETNGVVLTHHRDAVCLRALHNRAVLGLERAGAMQKRMEEMQTLVAQMTMRLKQCAERRKEMRTKSAIAAQLAHLSKESIAGGGRRDLRLSTVF